MVKRAEFFYYFENARTRSLTPSTCISSVISFLGEELLIKKGLQFLSLYQRGFPRVNFIVSAHFFCCCDMLSS